MAAETCYQAVTKSAPGTAIYRRRQPERSAVYQVVQGHLETWLAACRHVDEDGFPVAAYIEQDFRKYLTCGIHGPWICPGTLSRLRLRFPPRVLLQRAWYLSLLQYPADGGDSLSFK